MTMVVTQPCIGCKAKSCLPVCPVECFHEDEQMVYIDPDECIDCGACLPECPAAAIFDLDDVPDQWKNFIALNATQVAQCPSAHD